MTRSAARSVANVVLISAGVTAAYVIVTTPPLRRIAVSGLRWWLGASVPVFVMSQVREAWQHSARTA